MEFEQWEQQTISLANEIVPPLGVGVTRQQVKGTARETVDARHRHNVAGGKATKHAEKLAPVGPRTRHSNCSSCASSVCP